MAEGNDRRIDMNLENYTTPACEIVEMAVLGMIASSGFDDNNNTENPIRENWDSLG